MADNESVDTAQGANSYFKEMTPEEIEELIQRLGIVCDPDDGSLMMLYPDQIGEGNEIVFNQESGVLELMMDSMRVNWELWETLLDLGRDTHVSSRDFAIESAVEAFLNGMKDDPAYQGDAVVEGVVTPIVASRASALECNIKAPPGTDLHIGDLVECLDEDWLVVELYTDKVGILNGKMWVCNDILRFQNHSSTVHTRYCVVDDGAYSKNLTDPMAYVPTNTYKVYLSIDAATRQLFIDKRLSVGEIFGPNGAKILEVYKIVGIDLKSKNFGEGSHLMVVTMQRDVYNENADSIDEGLCDVFVDPNNSSEPALTGSCVIVGRDSIRLGTTRKYSAIFNSPEGDAVDDITPVWTVNPTRNITVFYEDNGLVISVPFKESLVGSEVTITLTDANGDYGTFEKKVQVIAVG